MSRPKDFEPHGQEEHIKKERYGLGDRIPLFRLSPQVNDPNHIFRTYSSSFILAVPELQTPELSFSVTLGSPEGRGMSIGMFSSNKDLTVEADLRKLAISVRDNADCAVSPITYYYTLDSQLTDRLRRLHLRVYDGEDGKVYEALPSERGLQDNGTLTFENDFHEIALDKSGKVASRQEKRTGLAYTLKTNTGAENTKAEFYLADDPLEMNIKAAAMGDPEEEVRIRKSIEENSALRDFFLHPGQISLTSTAPDFSGREFLLKPGQTVHIREVDGKLIRFVEAGGKVYVWRKDNTLESYDGVIPPMLKRKNRPFRF
ncbi:MAG: hypothetical protein Q7K55_01045 [Candidatus Levybacteria bacterium]|nr:hypothetical protein [Candidatus Levybacteria bacterium]